MAKNTKKANKQRSGWNLVERMMAKKHDAILKDRRTGKSIPLSIEVCDTFHARARGLMFRRKAVPLLFEFEYPARHAIHSFFVPFKFDAIYMDENWEVTDIFKEIKSFVPYISPRSHVKYLLELPCGMIGKINAKVGDELKITWGKWHG